MVILVFQAGHHPLPATSYQPFQETQSRGRKGSESPVRDPRFLGWFFLKKKPWGRPKVQTGFLLVKEKKIWYGYRVKVNV